MRDPVTGFRYPEEWVARCHSAEGRLLVQQGIAVLTSSGTVLRRGYTTGTTAAAACKASILSLDKNIVSVSVTIPCGLVLDVPVIANSGRAKCRKYAGDYPQDVTAGISFVATVYPQQTGLVFVPGTGIGRFGRDTPRFSKGTPAITAAPLACILRSMEEGLEETGLPGAMVRLDIPDGTAVAEKTLNLRVGVEGGISILGTTGLVEPWDDHLTGSVLDRVATTSRVVLTTGRTGLRFARLMYPDYEVVLIGSKIGDALAAAHGEVVLLGLPGLILRYLRPHILSGTIYATVEELSASDSFGSILADVLTEFSERYPRIRLVIINRDGAVLGESP